MTNRRTELAGSDQHEEKISRVSPIGGENKQGVTNKSRVKRGMTNGNVGLAGPDQKQGRINKGLTWQNGRIRLVSRTIRYGYLSEKA